MFEQDESLFGLEKKHGGAEGVRAPWGILRRRLSGCWDAAKIATTANVDAEGGIFVKGKKVTLEKN